MSMSSSNTQSRWDKLSGDLGGPAYERLMCDRAIESCSGCVRAQVIQQGDGYWCEQDSKSYDTMERRYVLRLKAADFTGETFLAVFNDQVRTIVDSTVHPLVEREHTSCVPLYVPCCARVASGMCWAAIGACAAATS